MADLLRDKLVQSLGIPGDKYDSALKEARLKDISVQQILANQALAPWDTLLQVFSDTFQIQVANLDSMEIPKAIINLVPSDLARKSRIVPIDRVGNHLIVAMDNPHDLKLLDVIRFKTGYSAKPVIASEPSISKAISKYYGAKMGEISSFSVEELGSTGVNRKASAERAVISETFAKLKDDDSPVMALVDQVLVQCMARGASDIHIEPYETSVRIRYRIDGVLHEVAKQPGSLKNALTSRVKILAGLNIAEKRLPQDGSIRVVIAEKPIDFRVNSVPTLYGEKIVLRILDKSSLQVDMTKLGFEEDDLRNFKEAISRPFGMVLVTGPTGSGKTTTLYSALAELNTLDTNIMTAEDPVEFNLEGINQVQVNPAIQFDFASALRAFLRQDPDVIMVGEIRDLETGQIAIKAALTGHMVLSTLHTNSAADTVVRLQNMGLESFNLISALSAIVAQRLARRICLKCRDVDESVTPEALTALGIHPHYASKVRAYRGKGCDTCGGTGNKGRIAIHEVMVVTDAIREAIMKGKPAMDLKRIAMHGGMRSLRQNALNKMVNGQIDAAEVTNNTTSDTDNTTKSAA